jgi:hypothetical protein
MITIKQEDYISLTQLMNLKTYSNDEIAQCETFIRTYIDHKASVCGRCSTEVSYAFIRLKKWYDKFNPQFNII